MKDGFRNRCSGAAVLHRPPSPPVGGGAASMEAFKELVTRPLIARTLPAECAGQASALRFRSNPKRSFPVSLPGCKPGSNGHAYGRLEKGGDARAGTRVSCPWSLPFDDRNHAQN